MKHIFHNKRISSIISILPSKIVRYADDLSNYPFPERQSLRLGQMMNYDTRRVCDDTDAISDYAIQGILHLFEQGVIKKEEVDGIIVVSSSQDYILPPVSYIIQGKLGLSSNVYCCDISQACAGYVYGLMQSFMVLDTLHLKKILLVTGDFLSKKTCKRDRNSHPIIGDAVNVSIVENPSQSGEIHVSFQNFGESADIISIPAGGMKILSSSETAEEKLDNTGNYRALDHFYMDGEEVFNFVMTVVPPMISDIIKQGDYTVKDIDYFVFHQPNKYMVNKLSDELGIDYSKMFDNIVGIYGNSSTATIPLNICHNLSDISTKQDLRLCLSGFGGGLTCNAMILKNPPMDFCSIIEYKRS